MKRFTHINAKTIDEAVSALKDSQAVMIAGGTDLVGTLKGRILPEYPQTLVNLKTIPGLEYIREENGSLKIGALTRLKDIAENAVIKSKYRALAEAAGKAASPSLRNMGTLGGNLCQLNRCWYFRSSHNYFNCLRERRPQVLCPHWR